MKQPLHIYTHLTFETLVRGQGKNARLRRVNLILLDELERALATFKSESYKIKERGEHIFALISFATFLDQARKVELK